MNTIPELNPEQLDDAMRRLAISAQLNPAAGTLTYKRVPRDVVAPKAPAPSDQPLKPHWTDVIDQACRDALEAHGINWWRDPDAAVSLTLTDAARRVTYIDQFGMKKVRRLRKDRVVPHRRFWPPGTFPAAEVERTLKRYDPYSVLSRMDGLWKGPMADFDWRAYIDRGVEPPALANAPTMCAGPQRKPRKRQPKRKFLPPPLPLEGPPSPPETAD